MEGFAAVHTTTGLPVAIDAVRGGWCDPRIARGRGLGGGPKATAYASAPLPAGSAPMLRLASRFIGRTENRQTRTVSTSAAGCER